MPLPSVDESLRLPLLHIGACAFRLTPLLRIVMPVTQTCREIVSILRRFRTVAVAMEESAKKPRDAREASGDGARR